MNGIVTEPRVPGLGVMLVLFMAGTITGAASAALLHDVSPYVPWAMVVAFSTMLYLLVDNSANRQPTPVRVGLFMACWGFATFFAMVTAGEAYPRRLRSDLPLTVIAKGLGLVATLGSAALLPTVLVVLALRRAAGARRLFSAAWAPPFIRFALAAAMVVFIIIALFTAVVLSPRGAWQIAALLMVAVGVPAVSLPFWATLYRLILRRWRVAPLPPSLEFALATLKAQTNFTFDDALCLDPQFGQGRICEVVHGLNGSTLILSATIPEAVTPAQLLALVSHEAAHICLNHFRRKIIVGILVSLAAIVLIATGVTLVSPWLPRAMPFLPPMIAAFTIVVARGLYEALVSRRHEAEADEFAAAVASPEALLSALEALNFTGFPASMVHNRWTTHGTWEVRSARIRGFAQHVPR